MRSKALLIITVLALLLAACGGGETESEEEPVAAVEEVADEAEEVVEEAEEVAEEAPEEPEPKPEPEPEPGLEAALAAAGTYTGTWTNTTFTTSGAATLTLTVGEDGAVTMEWDLGGGVFGGGDPDGENQALNVGDLEGGITITSALFGEMLVASSGEFGTLTMDAEDVPAGGIQAFRATATFGDDGTITGTYVVEWEDGGDPAVGVFEMARG
jgi:hypothetical protein